MTLHTSTPPRCTEDPAFRTTPRCQAEAQCPPLAASEANSLNGASGSIVSQHQVRQAVQTRRSPNLHRCSPDCTSPQPPQPGHRHPATTAPGPHRQGPPALRSGAPACPGPVAPARAGPGTPGPDKEAPAPPASRGESGPGPQRRPCPAAAAAAGPSPPAAAPVPGPATSTHGRAGRAARRPQRRDHPPPGGHPAPAPPPPPRHCPPAQPTLLFVPQPIAAREASPRGQSTRVRPQREPLALNWAGRSGHGPIACTNIGAASQSEGREAGTGVNKVRWPKQELEGSGVPGGQ